YRTMYGRLCQLALIASVMVALIMIIERSLLIEANEEVAAGSENSEHVENMKFITRACSKWPSDIRKISDMRKFVNILLNLDRAAKSKENPKSDWPGGVLDCLEQVQSIKSLKVILKYLSDGHDKSSKKFKGLFPREKILFVEKFFKLLATQVTFICKQNIVYSIEEMADINFTDEEYQTVLPWSQHGGDQEAGVKGLTESSALASIFLSDETYEKFGQVKQLFPRFKSYYDGAILSLVRLAKIGYSPDIESTENAQRQSKTLQKWLVIVQTCDTMENIDIQIEENPESGRNMRIVLNMVKHRKELVEGDYTDSAARPVFLTMDPALDESSDPNDLALRPVMYERNRMRDDLYMDKVDFTTPLGAMKRMIINVKKSVANYIKKQLIKREVIIQSNENSEDQEEFARELMGSFEDKKQQSHDDRSHLHCHKMSSIYVHEPTACGKVLLDTTVGPIEVEFWTKQCPKATRNFIQHCLDGYYDNTIFHRVVKDFIVVGGDPTSTGDGGESIYGQPFKDEFHSRLKFTRRGLLATANLGKDENKSQFFFTLGAAPELQQKHTIFGRVIGDTLYNMIRLGESHVDNNQRPFNPQRIVKATVIDNPFPDMVARPRSEKPSNDGSLIEKQTSDNDANRLDSAESEKTFNLLSFGDDAEEVEEESEVVAASERSKSKSSHDLSGDPTLSSRTAVDSKSRRFSHRHVAKLESHEDRQSEEPPKEDPKPNEDSEVEEDEVYHDAKRHKPETDDKIAPLSEIQKGVKASEKKRLAAELLLKETEELLVKAAKIPPKGSQNREVQTLDMMENFRKKLESARQKEKLKSQEAENDEDGEIRDDDDWLSHEFRGIDPLEAIPDEPKFEKMENDRELGEDAPAKTLHTEETSKTPESILAPDGGDRNESNRHHRDYSHNRHRDHSHGHHRDHSHSRHRDRSHSRHQDHSQDRYRDHHSRDHHRKDSRARSIDHSDDHRRGSSREHCHQNYDRSEREGREKKSHSSSRYHDHHHETHEHKSHGRRSRLRMSR
ncbi:Spliceosome-associated protein CWC27-like protein, partial [Fragariocoptes setiger]